MATGSYFLTTGFIGRHASAGVVDCAIEVFHICARASAAARHYEQLKRLSDADLAERGLKRADLPRAAFHMLTEDALALVHAAEDDLRRSDFPTHGSRRDSLV
jgi:hypothetical protein